MTASRPAAMTASGDPHGVLRAIAWCEQHRRSGQQVAVWAPGKQNVSGDAQLTAYARTHPLLTLRATSVSWAGGPLLAAWPGADDLARLSEQRRATALAVVTWRDDDVAAWAGAHTPELLTPGADAPAPAPALDPVVEQALLTMTGLVNQANHLAGTLDRRDAIAVLTVLSRAGYQLDPDAVYAWALAHDWRATGAGRLREMTARFAAGKPMRLPTGTTWPLRDTVLEQWRHTAAGG